MASFYDLMIGFHFFPHTDQFERGDELMRLIPALVDGTLRPTCHVEHLPILMPSNSTDAGWPMGVCVRARARARVCVRVRV